MQNDISRKGVYHKCHRTHRRESEKMTYSLDMKSEKAVFGGK